MLLIKCNTSPKKWSSLQNATLKLLDAIRRVRDDVQLDLKFKKEANNNKIFVSYEIINLSKLYFSKQTKRK